MDVTAGLVKLKPGSLDRVRAWARTINERESEALATLRDEGVRIESWFLISLEDGDYLLSYMRADDIETAHEAVKESLHEIDAYHQEFKRATWLRGSHREAQLLVDLSLEKAS